jgi:hypothetical protein
MDIYECVKLDKTPQVFWTYLGIVIGAAAFGLVILLVFAFWARNHMNSVTCKIGDDREVVVTGPMVGAVVFVLGFVAIIWGINQLREELVGDYRAKVVAVDAPETLSSVKELLSAIKEGQIEVSIDSGVANFPVGGRYEAACIADVWQRICMKYNDGLSCNDILQDRVVKIGRRTPPQKTE